MSKMFNDFKFDSVIICFTYCDVLDNEIGSPKAKSKE